MNKDQQTGALYFGDLRQGDREATAEEISAWEASRAPTYQELRAAEYPPMTDYLDGVVKGDQALIAKYIADCKAVKAKYPKA